MRLGRSLVKTLERLYIMAKRIQSWHAPGQRRSRHKGASLEFHDYRGYVAGDEIRYIDWNVYARHGELFIKEFTAEESVHVALLVDTSASMDYGDPSKFEIARIVAAAIGYIALAHYDMVSLYQFDSALRPVKLHIAGKGRIFELIDSLEMLRVGGATDMRTAFAHGIQQARGRSVAIAITDFYDLKGFRDALRSLIGQKNQVHAVQLLSPQEQSPGLEGRYVVKDVETAKIRDLYVSDEIRQKYAARLQSFLSDVESFCREHETHYVRCSTDEGLESIVNRAVRAGILEFK